MPRSLVCSHGKMFTTSQYMKKQNQNQKIIQYDPNFVKTDAKILTSLNNFEKENILFFHSSKQIRAKLSLLPSPR